MIGFVTWPGHLHKNVGTKRWPSDKANHIVVKMLRCKLLYIIQVKGFSWPYLISKVLVAYKHSYNAASDWPYTFLQPSYFC